MPDYVYIDPNGNMVGNNYQDNPQAAIEHGRELAADHQANRICVAEVVEYKAVAPQCHMCHKYFAAPVYDEGGPTCPACDEDEQEEPICPHCGSQGTDYYIECRSICTKCRKDIYHD